MKFFQFIPGFRTRVLWKQIISSIYYILTIYYFIHTWGALTFLISMPFAFFSFIDIIRVNPIVGNEVANKYIFIVSTILMVIGAIGVLHSFFNINNINIMNKKKRFNLVSAKEDTKKERMNEEFKVHFLSIGQGDCILIQQGNENVLIDSGYRINGRFIERYLKNNGIKKLHYIIMTHPHPDHIGSMPRILNKFFVENIIMSVHSKYPTEKHQNMNDKILNIAKKKHISVIHPISGSVYNVGKAYFKILAPNSQKYQRVNNYSIVTKFVFGEISFLFTGDAEECSENEMLNKGFDLKSDVLKVSHHGSCTSSYGRFLKSVSPKHAVISVGYNSFYGQPDKCVLDRLLNLGTLLYRTDKQGTIVAKTNGTNIVFNVNNCPYPKTKIFHTSIRKKYKLLHGKILKNLKL